MPRTPSIRYFESRSAYYCQYHGRQHLLAAGPRDEPDGPVYRLAVKRFAEIMHLGEMERSEDTCPVSAVVARYYHFLDREGRKKTLLVTRSLLDPALVDFGHVRVRDLKPIHVTDWLARMAEDPGKAKGRFRAWSLTTRSTALDTLSGAFSWGVRQGVISRNPIAGIARLEKRARGKEVVLPEGLQDALIANANPELAKFLRMLRGTGARPGEVIHAECKHYQPAKGAIVFPWNPPDGEWRWKAAKKTKRDRLLYLTPELRALVEEEVKARGGKGRIFQTARGVPWRYGNLRNRVALLATTPAVAGWCDEHGFDPGRVIVYGFRHSFITRMMTKGAPILLVANLCGTSVKQIERTYSHLHSDHDAMMRLFLQFSGAGAAPASALPAP